MCATTWSTARSMPRFSASGFAPAVTFFETLANDRLGQHGRGRRAVAGDVVGCRGDLAHELCALVLERILTSISRAMVTPSLVIVGAPNFLSRTT